MLEVRLLNTLIEETKASQDWDVLRRAVDGSTTVHLAVMIEPFLSYILEGRKTIESRFSKHAIAPYFQIQPGDLVLLKLSGGPILGCFTTTEVEFVTLTPSERGRLIRDYSAAICADEDFWKARTEKRFASLIGVGEPQELTPAPAAKSDRRGWVVMKPERVRDDGQLALL